MYREATAPPTAQIVTQDNDSQTPTFDLLTQPWIECEGLDGKDVTISIRQVFDGTTGVRSIRGDHPLQDYAVLRLLLAIFWSAHRVSGMAPGEVYEHEEWMEDALEDARAGGPDQRVLDYLDRHAERFDLLHPTVPFMQVADLQPAGKKKEPADFSVGRITHYSGRFSMRSGERSETLTFAEAARYLLFVHAYDSASQKTGMAGDEREKKGKVYGRFAWGSLGTGTTIIGQTLRETLVLNTASAALTSGPSDLPFWERAPYGPGERPEPLPSGPIDLAVWQPRRARLFHDGRRVISAYLGTGDNIPGAGEGILSDPMTPYKFSREKLKKRGHGHNPKSLNNERTMRGTLGALATPRETVPANDEGVPLRAATLDELSRITRGPLSNPAHRLDVSLVSAKYVPEGSLLEDILSVRLRVPVALLRPEIPEVRETVLAAASLTLDVAKVVGDFAGELDVAAGESPDRGSEYRKRPDVVEAFLLDAESAFANWLAALDVDNVEGSSRRWQEALLARSLDRALVLIRGAGPKAIIGREVTYRAGGATKKRLSTGSGAHSLLRHKLREALPLAHPSNDSEEKTTRD